jgi:serine/threonine protein kinase
MAVPLRPRSYRIDDGAAYLAREDALKIRALSEFEQKYDVIETLHIGAIAEVDVIEDRETKEQFAAKKFAKAGMREAKRLWDELFLFSRLSHPFVHQVVGAYSSPTHYIIVSQYAKGGNLETAIASDPDFGELHTKQLIKQLLEAVIYLHERQVAHRNIKPENLLFADTGLDTLKLSDYSLPAILTSDALLKSTDGTASFLAPEVLVKPDAYAFEADIWATGVLVYFLLSGKLPFEDETPDGEWAKIQKGAYEYGPEFEGVSEGARDFVKQCLIVDPKGRIAPKAALAHPWLAPIEGEEAAASAARGAVLEKLKSRKEPRTPYTPAPPDAPPSGPGEVEKPPEEAATAPSAVPPPAVQEEEEEEDVQE